MLKCLEQQNIHIPLHYEDKDFFDDRVAILKDQAEIIIENRYIDNVENVISNLYEDRAIRGLIAQCQYELSIRQEEAFELVSNLLKYIENGRVENLIGKGNHQYEAKEISFELEQKILNNQEELISKTTYYNDLQKYKSKNEELKELLIKNLPTKIKSGNEKHLSNIYEYQTVKALDKCKFINFNSDKQISFMVFDIDKYEDKTAKEYFKNIDGFYEYISEKIGLEPTYILETQKGFHFAYHLKNHIFTNQKKPLNYLLSIKQAITELLKCDSIASNRLYGIWRNPLLHQCYYSQQINYELKDFKELLPQIEYKNHSIRLNVKINEYELIEGQINNTLFKYAMRYAKNQKSITQNDVLNYLIDINESKQVNLLNSELNQISNSVFKYWQNGKIRYGAIPTKKDINEGIMNFSKMKNLSKEEYELETKQRQKAAALRTVNIRDKEKNKKQLLEAKKDYILKLQTQKETLVINAILQLQEQKLKVNIASISKIAEIDRRTAKKYFLAYIKY